MTDEDDADHPDELEADENEDVEPNWPWSFILLVVAGALYLILRFVELAIKLLK